MIRSDVVRSITTFAVPVMLWTEVLRLWHLAVLVAASTSLGIAFSAASGAYLKQLVPAGAWQRANARFESARWTIAALVTPLGGVVVALVGPATALTIDAITYLGSALLLRSIRSREAAPPPVGEATQHKAAQLTAGWAYINRVTPLRSLFANAMLFGGYITLVGPLLAVFILRDLELGPTHYGLALGLPAIGGVVGSRLSPTINRRLGWRRTLLGFGTLRTVWMLLIPLGSPGAFGFTLILVAQFMLMFSAGVFNPVFATYRMHVTDDDHMARVGAAWSISARTVQPAFIMLGGVLTGAIGLRPTILLAAIGLVATSALLPWNSTRPAAASPLPAPSAHKSPNMTELPNA